MSNKASDTSVIEIVDALLRQAVEQEVSDIHLESTMDGLRVRFRVDGLLYDQEPFQSDLMSQIISRIKVISNLDIAQKRVPQDGKFQFTLNDHTIDMRVSTFPTLFGQKVVIRILDPSVKTITIDHLGMSPLIRDQFIAMLNQPQGFFLVTGPTGSGKTTTLYAGLSHINQAEKNIITLEDPIEYHIEGITQGHIHPESGFTFEKGMRALLRQDPDIVMVGEIRDQQTAQIAVQSAMTGHLVLSTLHTNDAPSVIMRLMDMGIEPFLINSSLSGVLAQRLARTLCSDCKKSRPLKADEQLFCQRFQKNITKIYEAAGCESCFSLGYRGRIGVFELLTMSHALRELMNQNPSLEMIKAQAQKEGMITLMADGLEKVAQGIISLEELLRVIS
jgi:type II secretory ATPase GspE/PulE/Tfp pilus assembly ATPase PilB-like protein